jgi:hypothetical protein
MFELKRLLPVLALTLLASGCGNSGSDSAPVTGIPKEWLQATADEWPKSDGHDASMPVLAQGECVTFDGGVKILGAEPEITDVGYGHLSLSDSDKDYRYACNLWDPDHYAGSFQILKVTDLAGAQRLVDGSMNEADSSVQENSIATVEVDGLRIHVLKRWYPTNPHGEYHAMYVDEQALAIAALEVNSLDQDDFNAYSERQVAEDLVAILGSG